MTVINQATPLNAAQPLNVVVFAKEQYSVNLLYMLIQQQLLAGVVLSAENNLFNQQLMAELAQANIPYLQLNPQTTAQDVINLTKSQALIAINLGFDNQQLQQYSACFPLGCYHISITGAIASEPLMSQQQLASLLFWHITNSQNELNLSLQALTPLPDVLAKSYQQQPKQAEPKLDEHQLVVSQQSVTINALDTLQTAENKILNETFQLIGQFISQVIQQQNRHDFIAQQLLAIKTDNTASKALTEQDITVNWSAMTSQQIVDLARAANPHFNGAIISLGKTDLSLLQATSVTTKTYGVPAGTICHSGEPEGIIVACKNGAVRLDIISNSDGIFSGVNFCNRFEIAAGMAFNN